MSQLDDVREALQHKADQTRPADLAGAVLAQARMVRIRRRAAMGTGLLAVALAAVVAVPQVIGRGAAPDQPGIVLPSPTSGSSDDGKVSLGQGLFLAGGPVQAGARVWNRVTSAYVVFPDQSAWPAPVGDLVAVAKDGDDAADKQFYVTSTLNGEGMSLLQDQTLIGTPQWNAGGTQILYGIDHGTQDTVVYRIADLTTRQVRPLTLACDPHCQLVWLPDGSKVGHFTETGMDLYSVDTGAPAGTVGYQATSRNAWSPDGQKVVGIKDGNTALIDTATGQVICGSQDQMGSRQVYWLDDTRFVSLADELGYFDTNCHLKFSTTLPPMWTVTEPAEFTFAKE